MDANAKYLPLGCRPLEAFWRLWDVDGFDSQDCEDLENEGDLERATVDTVDEDLSSYAHAVQTERCGKFLVRHACIGLGVLYKPTDIGPVEVVYRLFVRGHEYIKNDLRRDRRR
ncbi:MAG: hypothetical protein V4684_02235 [Pseudomonadota bacterium]